MNKNIDDLINENKYIYDLINDLKNKELPSLKAELIRQKSIKKALSNKEFKTIIDDIKDQRYNDTV
tara:strand:+ start:2169 stop:2366 length:198 start_codon:yes stop_codon:yes gene_type:complete